MLPAEALLVPIYDEEDNVQQPVRCYQDRLYARREGVPTDGFSVSAPEERRILDCALEPV